MTQLTSNYIDITNSRLFGVPIATSLERGPDTKYGTTPIPLRNAIEFINSKCLDEQGLYRVPGNKRVVEQYREEFDRGEFIDFLSDSNAKTRIHEPHDVCGLVRMYITTLPETIFTDRLFGAFQLKEFSPDPDNPDEIKAKIERLKELCDELPSANRDALRLFIRHLHLITTNAQTNMMTAKNLVISLFGMAPHTRAYYLLIVHCSRIFTDDEAAPRSTTGLSPASAGDESPIVIKSNSGIVEQVDFSTVRKAIAEVDRGEEQLTARDYLTPPTANGGNNSMDMKERKKMSALRRASVRFNLAVANVFGRKKTREDEN
jgi:hypothetical protein